MSVQSNSPACISCMYDVNLNLVLVQIRSYDTKTQFCFTDHFNFLQRYLFIRHTNTNSDPNKKTNASVIVGKYVRNIFVTIGSGR